MRYLYSHGDLYSHGAIQTRDVPGLILHRRMARGWHGRAIPTTRVPVRLAVACCLVLASLSARAAVQYELVTVGDPGNSADTTGYGAVNYAYRIGKYEVTIGQYANFLNAVLKTDPGSSLDGNTGQWVGGQFNLWNAPVGQPWTHGISRSGSPGSFSYTAYLPTGSYIAGADSPTDRPMELNWFQAARFANWLSNGQPTGAPGPTTTEDGTYQLYGGVGNIWDVTKPMRPTRNAINPNTGATPVYSIPTENEWYKAAYYKGGGTNAGYWAFATQSDSPPGITIGSNPNQASYAPYWFNSQGYLDTNGSAAWPGARYVDQIWASALTNVGAFDGSPSAYGTFDQNGNLSEWNDLTGLDAQGNQVGAGIYSITRGGYFFSGSAGEMQASTRGGGYFNHTGIRLAAVTAPSTLHWASDMRLGGSGTWAPDSDARWAETADGSGPKQAWTNAQTGATAVLGGVAGSVTVSGTVEVNTLSVASGGYTISGASGSQIRFLGPSATMQLASSVSTTLNANLAGNGPLAITGTGSPGTARLGGTISVGGVRVTNALVSLSGTVQGDVSLSAGAGLGGSGRVTGTVGGAGSVSPGNSPGILTVNSVDPSGGLDFVFEFSGTAPNYADVSSSTNDVLRLTGATPFVSALDPSNTKILFLNFTKDQLSLGTVLKGGFFTDLTGDFTSLLDNRTYDNAGFQVYVLGDGNGHDNALHGQGYYNWRNPAMFGWTQSLFLATSAEIANFGAESVNGRIMTLAVAVPEPSTWALALAGIACGGWALGRRTVRDAGGRPRAAERNAAAGQI